MHAFHDYIGFEQGIPLVIPCNDCAIISRSDKERRVGGQAIEQPLKNCVFAKAGKRGGTHACMKRRTPATLRALKMK
jgi:hypothetical protein